MPREAYGGTIPTIEEFETQVVFDRAVNFLVIMWYGGGQREVRNFKELPEALACAEAWPPEQYGRTPIVRAVNQVGQAATLDRKDWPKWKERWFSFHRL